MVIHDFRVHMDMSRKVKCVHAEGKVIRCYLHLNIIQQAQAGGLLHSHLGCSCAPTFVGPHRKHSHGVSPISLCFGLEGCKLGFNIILVIRRHVYAQRHIHTRAHSFLQLPRIRISVSQRIEGAFHGITLERWVHQQCAKSGSATFIRLHNLLGDA
jgi:hypothetical protein